MIKTLMHAAAAFAVCLIGTADVSAQDKRTAIIVEGKTAQVLPQDVKPRERPKFVKGINDLLLSLGEEYADQADVTPGAPCSPPGATGTKQTTRSGECTDAIGNQFECTCTYTNTYTCEKPQGSEQVQWNFQNVRLSFCVAVDPQPLNFQSPLQ